MGSPLTQTGVGTGNVVTQPGMGGVSAWWTGHGLAAGIGAAAGWVIVVTWWFWKRAVQPKSAT